jgi:mannose-1-phosphate guanylyltransferase
LERDSQVDCLDQFVSGKLPTVPVVLAGGSGTRLWPLSARDVSEAVRPLLWRWNSELFRSNTAAAEFQSRVLGTLIVCHNDHRFLVKAGITPRAISLEPVSRNTAKAIAIAALYLKAREPGKS